MHWWVSCEEWKKKDTNNRLVQLKMIETIKWFQMEQVVKISWFADILTSVFINSNDGFNCYKHWFGWLLATKSMIDHFWSSESIKERLWNLLLLLFVSCTYIQRATNLPSRRSECPKWSGQSSKSWRNTLGQDTCKKLQGRDYFCIFYSFELKLGRMVELCIPKNPVFFVFRF